MTDYRFTDSDIEEEKRLEKRQEFLDSHNLTEMDVMQDDFNEEYVYIYEDGEKKIIKLN